MDCQEVLPPGLEREPGLDLTPTQCASISMIQTTTSQPVAAALLRVPWNKMKLQIYQDVNVNCNQHVTAL